MIQLKDFSRKYSRLFLSMMEQNEASPHRRRKTDHSMGFIAHLMSTMMFTSVVMKNIDPDSVNEITMGEYIISCLGAHESQKIDSGWNRV
jgi:hypothetical protein